MTKEITEDHSWWVEVIPKEDRIDLRFYLPGKEQQFDGRQIAYKVAQEVSNHVGKK